MNNEVCCIEFKDMLDIHHIQKRVDGKYIIWTCEGNVGEYPTFGDTESDKMNFCLFCGAKLP